MNKTNFFIAVSITLTLLWLPTLSYPIDSDMLHYSMLTENLIKTGQYQEFQIPHSQYIAGHSLMAIPFVLAFGKNIGFKLVTLFWTAIYLFISFWIFKDDKNRLIPYFITTLLLFNHSILFNAMSGASDIVFSAIFLISIYFFKLAQNNKKYYYVAGITAGIASLTRYPGVTLWVFFILYLGIKDWKRLFTKEVIIGNVTGFLIFCTWLLRNFVVFGNPFYSKYVEAQAAQVPNYLVKFGQNFLFFLNPFQNIFPILFLFMAYGMYKTYKKNIFLLLIIPSYMSIYLVWATPRTRHLLPLFPILFYFTIIGLFKLLEQFSKHKNLVIGIFTLGLLMNLAVIPLYTYGYTNHLIDQAQNVIPNDLSFTSEKHYSVAQIVDYINTELPRESVVKMEKKRAGSWANAGILRNDIMMIGYKQVCSNCYIFEKYDCKENVAFQAKSYPKFCLKYQE